jgi:hypothetical protein
MSDTSVKTAMDIPAASKSSPVSDLPKRKLGASSILNWVYCVIGIVVAVIPILVKPSIRLLIKQEQYTRWFEDVFSDVGIIIVAVTVGVSGLFELFTRSKKGYVSFLLGSLTVVFILVCFLLYGIVIGIEEYAIHLEKEQVISVYDITKINIAFFCLMFLISSLSFFTTRKRKGVFMIGLKAFVLDIMKKR